MSTYDTTDDELIENAKLNGWHIRRGIEDLARPWRRPWIGEKGTWSMYDQNLRSLLERIDGKQNRTAAALAARTE